MNDGGDRIHHRHRVEGSRVDAHFSGRTLNRADDTILVPMMDGMSAFDRIHL